MSLHALLIPLALAATADTMLGYTIGQPVSAVKLEKGSRGAYMTTANVAGEAGSLFVVPCGTVVHEIIFQVIVFPAATNDGVLMPSARYAVNPRQSAAQLQQTFGMALLAAGWSATDGTGGGTFFVRDGVYRSTWLDCEPYDAAVPGSGETCRASIHAGGAGLCTAGL